MSSNKIRIAIIDDEKDLLENLEMCVKDHLDCEVETFSDSVEALVRLQQQKFDVISLDHRMPKLTGMDILKVLRTSEGPNSKTRIIFISGYSEEAKSYHSELNLLNEVIVLDKPVQGATYIRYIKLMTSNKASA